MRFSVWGGGEAPRAQAAVSLADEEAERLARFLAETSQVPGPGGPRLGRGQRSLTARAWRAAAAGPSRPAGSSTTKDAVPGKRWFCQLGAVPCGQRMERYGSCASRA